MELKLKQLIHKKELLMKQLSKLDNCLPGNLNAAYLICNRGNCKCTRGERHGPSWRITWKEQQKSKILYIRNNEIKKVKNGITEYKKAKELLKELSFINLEILKLNRK
jgi:hypothetical protein